MDRYPNRKNEFNLLKVFIELNKQNAIIKIMGSKYSCIKGHKNNDIIKK